MTIQIKATEQYFPVVQFIMLYKVVITFEFANEILKCDQSNENRSAILQVMLCIVLDKEGVVLQLYTLTNLVQQ